MKKRKNVLQEQNYAPEIPSINNTVCNPYPMPQASAMIVPIPNGTRMVNSPYAINNAMELPAYMCTDEYGRVYQANVFYGTLPCHAPVPVPVPAMTPQVEPIMMPVQDNKRY